MSCEKIKNYLLKVESTKRRRELTPPQLKAFLHKRSTGPGRQVCRGCGMEGHSQGSCPHPSKRQCYYCLKLGNHMASECRKRKADEEAEDTSNSGYASTSKRGKSSS